MMERRNKTMRMVLWVLAIVVLAHIVGGGLLALWAAGVMELSWSQVVIWQIRAYVLIPFVLLGWREMGLLFRRPAKNMGAGWKRVWAVARATMFEAWSGRVWLLPVLWLGAGLGLILAVRPFDESERIPLYIRMLLTSQEALLLIMMWVMACVSLPRERERKILVTNASKPLSRLEIILGKITGFGAVAALLLVAMGLASLVVLHIADGNVRKRAQEAYDIQRRDFNKTLTTPSEGLRQLAEQGSLYAYNYIGVPANEMNIGVIRFPQEPGALPIRGLIGGTQEKAIYHFGPRLETPELATLLPAGQRPYFVFFYPYEIRNNPQFPPPSKVQIRVTAYATGPASSPQEKVLTLNDQFFAVWEPDRPDELFTTFDGKFNIVKDRGLVTVEVTCPTPGVLLTMLDGADPDAKGAPDTLTNIEFNNRYADYFPGTPQSANYPSARPVVRGFERRERQEIEGPKDKQPLRELAYYRFPGPSIRNVPVDEKGNFNLSVQLETYKADNPQDPTFVHILVHSRDLTGVPDFEIARQQVDEKRLVTIPVPAANLGDKDPVHRGDLVVRLYCATPGHSISLNENSVRIELRQTPFFINLFKSEAVIFMEALLLITLGVTCSVRVGWPIAMFCSALGYMFGHFVDFIAGLQEYGGLGALNYNPYGQHTALFNFFDTAAGALWKLLGFISILVPNFNLYQPQQYIASMQNMPWSVLGYDALNTVIFAVPFIGLAYLLFRKQELG